MFTLTMVLLFTKKSVSIGQWCVLRSYVVVIRRHTEKETAKAFIIFHINSSLVI